MQKYIQSCCRACGRSRSIYLQTKCFCSRWEILRWFSFSGAKPRKTLIAAHFHILTTPITPLLARDTNPLHLQSMGLLRDAVKKANSNVISINTICICDEKCLCKIRLLLLYSLILSCLKENETIFNFWRQIALSTKKLPSRPMWWRFLSTTIIYRCHGCQANENRWNKKS